MSTARNDAAAKPEPDSDVGVDGADQRSRGVHPGAAAAGSAVAAGDGLDDERVERYLSQIERGLHQPSLKVLQAIADASSCRRSSC